MCNMCHVFFVVLVKMQYLKVRSKLKALDTRVLTKISLLAETPASSAIHSNQRIVGKDNQTRLYAAQQNNTITHAT